MGGEEECQTKQGAWLDLHSKIESILLTFPDRFSRGICHGTRCGATTLMNSRDVITLVFFQNLG